MKGLASLPVLLIGAALTVLVLVATLEELYDLVAYAGSWSVLAVLPGAVLAFAVALGNRRRI